MSSPDVVSADVVPAVLKEAGIDLFKTNSDGKDVHRFDKHCLRATGAQFLARQGLDIPTIHLYSRHSSNAIMTYVQQAPLEMLPSTTRTAIAGVDASVPSNVASGQKADMAKIWAELKALQIILKKNIVDDMTPPTLADGTVGSETRLAVSCKPQQDDLDTPAGIPDEPIERTCEMGQT